MDNFFKNVENIVPKGNLLIKSSAAELKYRRSLKLKVKLRTVKNIVANGELAHSFFGHNVFEN